MISSINNVQGSLLLQLPFRQRLQFVVIVSISVGLLLSTLIMISTTVGTSATAMSRWRLNLPVTHASSSPVHRNYCRSSRHGSSGGASFVGLLDSRLVQQQYRRPHGQQRHTVTTSPISSNYKIPRQNQYKECFMSSSSLSSWSLFLTKHYYSSLSNIPSTSTSLFGHKEEVEEEDTQLSLLLLDLQNEMKTLNHGQFINVNSPKQVSMALFGCTNQSVTKKVLEQISNNGNNLDGSNTDPRIQQQQRLAQLILQYKQMMSQQQQQQQPPPKTISPSVTATTPRLFSSSASSSTMPSSSAASPPTSFSSATPASTSTSTSTSTIISPYEQQIESLFDKKTNQIDTYWKDPLRQLSKSTARNLATQLDSTQGCPMGYNPNATPQDPTGYTKATATTTTNRKTGGTFLDYCRSHKALYPHTIQLVRCGDFYETFGIDALMLIEHVGLNSMAGKLKAGCPKGNIQSTLDALTTNGFTVAVHEEVGTTTTHNTNTNRPRKQPPGKIRCLTQLVSPATPTYLYDNWLTGGENSASASSLDMLPLSRPCVGIVSTSTGYHLLEIWLEEQVVKIAERLTAEAVTCRLVAYPPAEPLLYIPSPTEYTLYQQSPSKLFSTLEFLSSSVIQQQPTSQEKQQRTRHRFVKTQVLPPMVLAGPTVGITDTERYSNAIVQAILQETKAQQPHQPPGNDNDDGTTLTEAMTLPKGQQRRPTKVQDFTIVLETSSSSQPLSTDQDGIVDDSTSTKTTTTVTRTNPLYVETATQLGLLDHMNNHIPSLVNCLVDVSAPGASRRFLQRYLLCPPPPNIAESMSCLVQKELTPPFFGSSTAGDDGTSNNNRNNAAAACALPPLHVPPLGKVLALLRVGQAGANIFGDLIQSLAGTQQVLQLESFGYQPEQHHEQYDNGDTRRKTSTTTTTTPMQALLQVLQYESGLASPCSVQLANQCYEAQQAIQAILSPLYHIPVPAPPTMPHQQGYHHNPQEPNYELPNDKDTMSDCPHIPSSFIERNEAPWRGRVRSHVAKEAYDKVEQAVTKLNIAIQEDFVQPFLLQDDYHNDEDDDNFNKKTTKKRSIASPIVYDVFNNLVALKNVPPNSKDLDHYFPARDRHGKTMRNRLTTTKVQFALSDYTTACDEATDVVSALLTELAQTLEENGHIPAIVQSAHINLILSTVHAHASKASTMGWNLAETYEPTTDAHSHPHLLNVWPYWMDRSQAVANTFDLDGLFLLTAPNMSGKSTLMRSTAAAALLTMCGLCAPLDNGSKLPRIDTLFVRGASADVPSEDKSAFGAEMGDIAALMRCCGNRSWIFVDELGRGTSPTDGTRLAGAVLEAMAEKGMSGMFATHLHDLLQLPLRGKERIPTKRMAIRQTSTLPNNDGPDLESSYEWTYKLEDGVCTDSLALVTAARFGLPQEIIRRADELGRYLTERQEAVTPDDNRHGKTASPIVNNKGNTAGDGFDRAVSIAEDITGGTSIRIPPRWSPPAALCAGSSCVYVLEVPHDDKLNSRYYVGETDSLQQRLQQHRRKGGPWAMSQAAAFVTSSKTEARLYESLLIQKLALAGIPLESIRDGRSIRPAGRSSRYE